MLHPHRGLWLFLIAGTFGISAVFAQPSEGMLPHRVITAEQIEKAGDETLQRVLHYLLPDLFPKTDEAWLRTAQGVTFYVDKTRSEPEDLNLLDPKCVKRILIWEKPWEQAPAEFPSLLMSRYVVSIETS